MERIPNGVYTKNFREEAVKLVTEGGLSVSEVGSRLTLPKSTMANWIRAYKAGRLGEVGKLHRPLTDVEQELMRVKREGTDLTGDHVIGVEHLPREFAGLKSQMAAHLLLSKSPLENEMASCEKSVLDQALRLTKGNMVRASKLLGISRSTLYEKCRRHHLSS